MQATPAKNKPTADFDTPKEATPLDFLLQSDIFSRMFNNFKAIKDNPQDILDILLVAFVVYELFVLIRRTRAAQLAKGAIVLLVVYAVVYILNLRAITWIMNSVLQIGFIALVILFQPELRRALEQMGQTDQWAAGLLRVRKLDSSLRSIWQEACLAICDAAEQLSDTRTGALIVFERKSNLSEIIRTGTPVNADVNRDMLGTIFYEGTPLHDGAVVVRDGVLKAAGCVLPLSDNLEIGKDMGTRHRAALGMSENSDAVIVVVSEETGIISLAKNGVLIRRLDRQTLFELLQEEIVPPEEKTTQKQPFWRKKNEE